MTDTSTKYLTLSCHSMYTFDLESDGVKAMSILEIVDQDDTPTTPVYGCAVRGTFTCGTIALENLDRRELVSEDTYQLPLYNPTTDKMDRMVSHASFMSTGLADITDMLEYQIINENQVLPVDKEKEVPMYLGCVCLMTDGRVSVVSETNMDKVASVSPDMNVFKLLAKIDQHLHEEVYEL